MTFFMIMTFAIMFAVPLAHTPIALGLWIIILAILIAMNMSLFISSWFSFIMFLIYVGGLLVMFAYFLAINPDKKINMLNPMTMAGITMAALIFTSSRFWLLPAMNLSNISSQNSVALLTTQYMTILIIMAITLLIMLIAVVKITARFQGTLRPFM